MSELDNIKKETGFKIPDGYFEDFSKKMEESILEKAEENTIIRILKPILSVLQLFLILFMVRLLIIRMLMCRAII